MWLPLVALSLACHHVPNIASYALVETPQGWHLDVVLPTDGVHRALSLRHPEEQLSALDVDAYEDYLVDALTAGVVLARDGVPIELGAAVVGLAPHETHIRFALPPLSANSEKLEARIDALNESGGQHNVLRVQTQRVNGRIVLSEKNDFAGVLQLQPKTTLSPLAVAVGAGGGAGALLCGLPFGIAAWRRRSPKGRGRFGILSPEADRARA